MNLTRERIRQVEVKALAKLEALQDMYALRDYVEEGPVGKRRLPTLSKEELSGKGKTKVKAKVEADKAVEIARNTEGVKSVNTKLTVQKDR